MRTNEYYVKWTGKYPVMCSGVWELRRNGHDVSDLIPLELRSAPMNTFGSYKRYSLTPVENWYEYEDGLKEEEWISKNLYWISQLCDTKTEMIELYRAICAEDWRHGECGGCL